MIHCYDIQDRLHLEGKKKQHLLKIYLRGLLIFNRAPMRQSLERTSKIIQFLVGLGRGNFKFNTGRDKGSSSKHHIRGWSGEMKQNMNARARSG